MARSRGTKKARPPGSRALNEAIAAKEAWSQHHFLKGERATAPETGRLWARSRRVSETIARAGAHVHAIGVGRKVVGGRATNALSVRVYVTQKLPKAIVPASARVPPMVDGIPTDVIEAPPAFLAASAPIPPCSFKRTHEQRPLRGGISAANIAVNAGTIGVVCRSTRSGDVGTQYILGNNHVFADLGAALLGSDIVQPSPADGGDASARIATLARFVPIDEREEATNRVDAALAELLGAVDIQAEVCSIGVIVGTNEPQMGATVQKHGRTTGLTRGVIDDPSVDVLVPLSRHDPERVARFIQQIRIVPATGVSLFAQGGDSGALVTSRPGNRAVGLLFACPDNGQFAYANPIAQVLSALEISL